MYTYTKSGFNKSLLSREQQLAVDAWKFIAANPGSWHQGAWRSEGTGGEKTRCGAKLCWGGHVAVLDGGKFIVNDAESLYGDRLLADPNEKHSDDWDLDFAGATFEISTITVFNRLRNIFEGVLEYREIEDLVGGNNTLDQLKDLIIKYLRVNPETGELVTARRCAYGFENCKIC